MDDDQTIELLQWALPRLRMRWRGFRRVRRQVRKRLGRRLGRLGLSGAADYRRYLESHPEEWRVLDSICRVTISRFFRDRGIYRALGEEVLPELARGAARAGRPAVRCWSAGCASGEEPYSLRLVWRRAGDRAGDRAGARPRLRILASDSDLTLLARARRARYPAGSLREVPRELLEGAFRRVGELWELRPSHRRGVRLVCQDLRQTMPAGPFDLVLCRNLVFTYYEAGLQGELLLRLADRLVPGGVLVIGSHESLPAGGGEMEPWAGQRSIYRAPRPERPVL